MSNPADPGYIVDRERVDYISNLPDSIICEILSYLPTKAAVKTSILSTKWRYIWTQVPTLDFSDMPHRLSDQQITCLKDLVDRVLLLNNASYIQRFCFSFDFYYAPVSIKSWLDAVKWREICEVSIELHWEELVPLPREFICGSNLVALNLNGFRIDDVPPSFHLPNLKTVHFGRRIAFPGDQFLKRFLLGCPVLKELFIHSTVGFDETICVESLSLKSLEVKITPERHGNAICINITAPNLWYLCLHDGPANYNIGDLNMLIEADLYVRGGSKCRWSIDDNTFQLLKKVSRVRTLRFRISPVLLYHGKLPTFENLTHLKLQNDQCTSELLKYAPKVKSLIFEKVGHIAPVFDPEAAHECMSCLESVEFFLVYNSALNFIEHFFKAAIALKEMIFNVRGLVRTGRLGAVCHYLMSLSIASPICQIKFVY